MLFCQVEERGLKSRQDLRQSLFSVFCDERRKKNSDGVELGQEEEEEEEKEEGKKKTEVGGLPMGVAERGLFSGGLLREKHLIQTFHRESGQKGEKRA